MNSSKITAWDLIEKAPNSGYSEKEHSIDWNDIEEIMIKFAKLHVKAALKAAAENAEVDYFEEYGPYSDGNYTCIHSVNTKSILIAYPETNIV